MLIELFIDLGSCFLFIGRSVRLRPTNSPRWTGKVTVGETMSTDIRLTRTSIIFSLHRNVAAAIVLVLPFGTEQQMRENQIYFSCDSERAVFLILFCHHRLCFVCGKYRIGFIHFPQISNIVYFSHFGWSNASHLSHDTVLRLLAQHTWNTGHK